MKATTRLRQRLASPDILIAPGAYDGLTARLVEQAGFEAVYMTGAGTSLSRGYPDLGLLGMSEMVENAADMARTVSIPLIADADTGYGNELNVTRTIRDYEQRGVAGFHIEDQVSPKKCGHLEGKAIIPRDEYIAKIRAAVAARRDPDFLIIARTDARAVVDLDEAIIRANAAFEMGADMAFVEAMQTDEELASVPKRLKGPCLLNIVPGGKTPSVDVLTAQRMGFALVIMPGLLLSAMVAAADDVLAKLKSLHEYPEVAPNAGILDLFARMGLNDWNALAQKKTPNQ